MSVQKGEFQWVCVCLCAYTYVCIGLCVFASASSLTSYFNHIWKGSAGRAGDREKLRST